MRVEKRTAAPREERGPEETRSQATSVVNLSGGSSAERAWPLRAVWIDDRLFFNERFRRLSEFDRWELLEIAQCSSCRPFAHGVTESLIRAFVRYDEPAPEECRPPLTRPELLQLMGLSGSEAN